MTGADVPPLAQEAMAAAEAAWLESYGLAGMRPEYAHEAWQAAWAAALEWAAQLAGRDDAFYDAPCPDGIADCVHQDESWADRLRAVASLLRQEAGHD